MTSVLTGKQFNTTAGRWSGVGPYYAMFPVDFAFDVVRRFSEKGDALLDPFAGRGTSVFAAACQDRHGYGIEINPVGWLYGQVKLKPANERSVQHRLAEINRLGLANESGEALHLPPFFSRCYAPRVLQFLTAARRELQWQTRRTDATLMAILLVYLHGKEGSALSNQMRQGKAMSPDYSIRWWDDRDKHPPDIDVQDFLKPRIAWRFAKGTLNAELSHVYLGDSNRTLPRLARMPKTQKCKLLFTSPPYHSITNYHYDQWLRLWMLGELDRPSGGRGEWQGKFDSKVAYERLLKGVFQQSKELLAKDAVIYVRTDARQFTLDTTVKVLTELFPEKRMDTLDQPLKGKTQTNLFGNAHTKSGEVDLVLMDRV
jgi:hypothetical protein